MADPPREFAHLGPHRNRILVLPCSTIMRSTSGFCRLVVISPTVSDRFTDTRTEAFPGDLWARASVRKVCPDFFCLTYAASVQSGHADPQSENREPDEKPGRMRRSCH